MTTVVIMKKEIQGKLGTYVESESLPSMFMVYLKLEAYCFQESKNLPTL